MWKTIKPFVTDKRVMAVAGVAIVALLLIWIGINIERNRRNAISVERDKKAQETLVLAQKVFEGAQIEKAHNDAMESMLDGKVEKTAENQASLEKLHKEEKEKLNEKYSKEMDKINSDMSDVDRCIDVCKRSNALAESDPAVFGDFRCDPSHCGD